MFVDLRDFHAGKYKYANRDFPVMVGEFGLVGKACGQVVLISAVWINDNHMVMHKMGNNCTRRVYKISQGVFTFGRGKANINKTSNCENGVLHFTLGWLIPATSGHSRYYKLACGIVGLVAMAPVCWQLEHGLLVVDVNYEKTSGIGHNIAVEVQ